MLGVEVLNWYPNRNPSDETKRTTGFSNFLRARAVVSKEDCAEDEEAEEKKRKAKAAAAERAMQVRSRRAMKTIVVDGF